MRTGFDGGFDPGFGFAVTERTILLPLQADRQGTYVSPSTTVPEGAVGICLTAEIPPADRETPGRSFSVDLEASSDGQVWEHVAGFTWEAPSLIDPYVALPASVLPGSNVRLIVSVPVAITMGASVEVV